MNTDSIDFDSGLHGSAAGRAVTDPEKRFLRLSILTIVNRLNHEQSKEGEAQMKFMMIVKANKDSEAGKMPSEDLLAAMAKYNEELVKSGILLDMTGLQPSSKGARVKFSGNKTTVLDGPFAETKELIAGYWLINVKSREEAIDWAKRAPNPYGPDGEGHIEIRQLFELEDFPQSDAVEHHRKVGDQLAKQKVS